MRVPRSTPMVVMLLISLLVSPFLRDLVQETIALASYFLGRWWWPTVTLVEKNRWAFSPRCFGLGNGKQVSVTKTNDSFGTKMTDSTFIWFVFSEGFLAFFHAQSLQSILLVRLNHLTHLLCTAVFPRNRRINLQVPAVTEYSYGECWYGVWSCFHGCFTAMEECSFLWTSFKDYPPP